MLSVAKGIVDCLELLCHDGFFRKLGMGNKVLIKGVGSNSKVVGIEIFDSNSDDFRDKIGLQY